MSCVLVGFPEAIKGLRQTYIDKGSPSYFEINNGLCDSFAGEVANLLGGESEHVIVLGAENFMTGFDGDPYENDIWDWDLLHKWGIFAPEGLTSADLDAIPFGSHVWISDGTLHFDAECPDGVASFFDLPLYRRYVIEALRTRGIPADDVVTDDVRAAPKCKVPNPISA
jgi:hypothetical protein